jgi:hypothetical protein
MGKPFNKLMGFVVIFYGKFLKRIKRIRMIIFKGIYPERKDMSFIMVCIKKGNLKKSFSLR